MLSLLLMACSTPAPEPVPVEPVVEASPQPDDGVRYVMASTLNLRDESGAKKGRLAINTQLLVLQEEGERSQVRVANGSEGWVATAFLGEQPLQPSELVALAQASEDPELRLASLQRAAAIDPSRSTLKALEAEYRAQGDSRRAGIVAQQIAWPEHLKPAVNSYGQDSVQIEFPLSWEQPGSHEQRMARTKAEIPIKVGDPVWVLPAYGAAVQGRVTRLEWMSRNECSGDSAWVASIQASLPPGERALMVSLQPPPSSWSQRVAPPAIPQAKAEQLLSAKVSSLFNEEWHLDRELYREGPNWRVVVRKDEPWKESEEQDTMFGFAQRLDVVTTPQGGTKVLGQSRVNLDNEDFEDWRVSRDLSGDGTMEELRFSDCNTLVYEEGAVQTYSIYRCCKC